MIQDSKYVIHPELKAQIHALLHRKFDKELEVLNVIQTNFEEKNLTIHNINDAIGDEEEGTTLLHHACKKLYVRLVHFLATNFYNNEAEESANINIKDSFYQNTPLHDAVMWPPFFKTLMNKSLKQNITEHLLYKYFWNMEQMPMPKTE